MKYLGRFASFFVLTLALGSFTPQAASGGWFAHGSHLTETNGGGSVPIPGTFLLLAGGLAGLALHGGTQSTRGPDSFRRSRGGFCQYRLS